MFRLSHLASGPPAHVLWWLCALSQLGKGPSAGLLPSKQTRWIFTFCGWFLSFPILLPGRNRALMPNELNDFPSLSWEHKKGGSKERLNTTTTNTPVMFYPQQSAAYTHIHFILQQHCEGYDCSIPLVRVWNLRLRQTISFIIWCTYFPSTSFHKGFKNLCLRNYRIKNKWGNWGKCKNKKKLMESSPLSMKKLAESLDTQWIPWGAKHLFTVGCRFGPEIPCLPWKKRKPQKQPDFKCLLDFFEMLFRKFSGICLAGFPEGDSV